MNQGLIIWSPGVTLDNVEEQVIRHAFKFFQRNKTATANALGISIRTLDSRLERYDESDRISEQRRIEDQKRSADWLKRARGQAEGNAIPSPAAGVRVESVKEASAQHPVPVSESQEVQKVLSKQASSGGSRNRR